VNHPFAPNNFSARTTGTGLTAIDIENGQLTRCDKRQRIKIVPMKVIIVRGKIKFVLSITCRLALGEAINLICEMSESFVHTSPLPSRFLWVSITCLGHIVMGHPY